MYFDGRVQSLGLDTAEGYATVGVITRGRYTFMADDEEHVAITSGSLRIRLPGASWMGYTAPETYVVPRGVSFEVEADADVSYLYRYVGRGSGPRLRP